MCSRKVGTLTAECFVRRTVFAGIDAAVLVSGDLEATFVPDVGMVGISLRHGGSELLYGPLEHDCIGPGQLIGIPLLAPWANRIGADRYQAAGIEVDLTSLHLNRDANGLPIHGTMAAQSGWEVRRLEVSAGAAVLEARFPFGSHPDLLLSFPFPHDLGIAINLREDTLSISTKVQPSAEQAVPIAFGYHPHLRIPGSPRSTWTLTLPSCAHVLLDERRLPTEGITPVEATTIPLENRPFDNLFALTEKREIILATVDRQLVLDVDEGYRYVQIYSPSDAEFVCLEPMTAPADALRSGSYLLIEPGDEFTANFSIRVERAF